MKRVIDTNSPTVDQQKVHNVYTELQEKRGH
jgi:hypothetical protein